MAQATKKKAPLVPKLRFPEFVGGGEWEEKRLGDDDVSKMSGGGTPSTSITEYWMGDIPWVSSSDITDESVFDINIRKHITESAIQNSSTKLCPSNTILVVTRVGLGKVALSRNELCTSQDFTNIVCLNSNKLFLTYYLSRKMKTLLKQSQGTSIKGITTDELKCLVIYLPSNDEQQRIADCLTFLDKYITAQGQKIALLKEHKKGLMQQLFPNAENTGL